jgi:hypothetical protein
MCSYFKLLVHSRVTERVSSTPQLVWLKILPRSVNEEPEGTKSDVDPSSSVITAHWDELRKPTTSIIRTGHLSVRF